MWHKFSLPLVVSLACLTACGKAVSPLASVQSAGVPEAASSLLPASGLSPIPPELREQMAAAEHLIGNPSAFPNDAAKDAYLSSLVQALPAAGYDREGFLAKLGVAGMRSPGKQDGPTFYAVLQLPGYRPGTLVDGKEILPQVMAFDIAVHNPRLFMQLIRATNASVEAPSRNRAVWKRPYSPAGTPQPTGEVAQQRYAPSLAKLTRSYGLLFDDDFHAGLPAVAAMPAGTYGTFAIATSLGFTETQAWRVASYCNRIDYDTTPYGKTSFSPAGQMDRHFNLDRGGQDTRLVWAQRHLDGARALAKAGAFDQAEVEIGCGLHSLQDVVAHGQLTPSMHGVIGEFPDQVTYDPIAVYEATQATVAYLHAYLDAVATPVTTP
ncbi:MAG: hypothetical protein JWM80_1553 [Cyanobacteria bacterium RYN_339]|nr:hypothetical protein [Cyanobacteria bacterium RYN_339]